MEHFEEFVLFPPSVDDRGSLGHLLWMQGKLDLRQLFKRFDEF